MSAKVKAIAVKLCDNTSTGWRSLTDHFHRPISSTTRAASAAVMTARPSTITSSAATTTTAPLMILPKKGEQIPMPDFEFNIDEVGGVFEKPFHFTHSGRNSSVRFLIWKTFRITARVKCVSPNIFLLRMSVRMIPLTQPIHFKSNKST